MLWITETGSSYPDDGTSRQRGHADCAVDERLMPELLKRVETLAKELASGYPDCDPNTALKLARQDVLFGIVGMIGVELGAIRLR